MPQKDKRPKIYWVWAGMKRRCSNPNVLDYQNYGARGISVSEEWKSFKNFLKDMGESYRAGLSLDRINNEGNYCKENCRWATSKEQRNNTRANKLFTYMGITDNILNWANHFSLKRSTLSQRIYAYGWDFGKSIHTPARKRGQIA